MKMNENGMKLISDIDDIESSINMKSEKDSSSDIHKRKNHNCPYCDRSFTRPYRLNDHISFSHTDEVN